MNTTKKRGRPAGKSRCECSCVAYLENESLLAQLMPLVNDGTIGHFYFVEHEADEDVRKPHRHLRMLPPASKSVDWASVCGRIEEWIPGEPGPRKLVLYHGSINDAWQDALLYARHDSRYLKAKGLVKQTVDYPIDRFYTDSREWLEQIWAASDFFKPEPKKLTKEDIMDMIDSFKGRISNRELLRIVARNNFTFGDFQLFGRYRAECLNEQAPAPVRSDPSQPDLPIEGI